MPPALTSADTDQTGEAAVRPQCFSARHVLYRSRCSVASPHWSPLQWSRLPDRQEHLRATSVLHKSLFLKLAGSIRPTSHWSLLAFGRWPPLRSQTPISARSTPAKCFARTPIPVGFDQCRESRQKAVANKYISRSPSVCTEQLAQAAQAWAARSGAARLTVGFCGHASRASRATGPVGSRLRSRSLVPHPLSRTTTAKEPNE